MKFCKIQDTLNRCSSFLDVACMLYNIVDDRHFSITAPVEISDQFYGWVLGFGKKAKILKPQKVVDGFTEYLDKIRNMYES